MSDALRQQASEIEGLLQSGGVDPFTLLAGQWHFHSVFLAPFSPSFAAARQQFLADGSGPLAQATEQLRAQGMPPLEAAAAARRLIEAAQGLCVGVVAGDHGVATVPQPFYGHLAEDWRQHAAQALGNFATEGRKALDGLQSVAAYGWPRAVAGPALGDDLPGYWLELGHGLADALELAGGRDDARLADLGHWVASALAILRPTGLDAEDQAMLARCHLVAGEITPACARIAACAEAGGEEPVVELFDALATAAARRGGDAGASAWLAADGAAIAARLGCAYDAALAHLRVCASAGDAGIPAAVEALVAANRKLARQALTREPLWQVTARDPGELIDTATAAARLERSPTFVAKKLEARTIPFHVAEGQIRLPVRALDAWKLALDRHKLLD